MRLLGQVSVQEIAPYNVAHAWAFIDASAAIQGQFNVSSITDNGVGDFTFNFAIAAKRATYSCVANGVGVQGAGVGCTVCISSAAAPTAAAVRTQGFTADVNAASDTPTFIVVAGEI